VDNQNLRWTGTSTRQGRHGLTASLQNVFIGTAKKKSMEELDPQKKNQSSARGPFLIGRMELLEEIRFEQWQTIKKDTYPRKKLLQGDLVRPA